MMTYTGTVRKGTVLLEPHAEIPDGAQVRVELPQATAKGELLDAVRSLRDDVSLDAGMEELYLLYKIKRGIRQADAGETMSHEEARERLKEWLE